ncbi:MFS transporter [Phenylobacterium montanum]|uniref:MFS transporter n=1 Tax=Phenylobacterium montanum TaxID=2823693 RepID=A0A975IU68_9CAUL|nr:MFS transporter [Caulobacter sp. S6]QUD87483.1 MFS transporter [Caulobacter sp. S6]
MRADRTEPAAGRSTAAFYTLLSVMFINMLGFGVVVPLLPFFAKSFHAGPLEIALIFSAYSMGSFFGEPFWGRLSDRIGRKPLLISTLIGNCLCYGLLAFAPNVWFAFFIRLFGGMAAGNGSVVQGYIADVTEPDDRAQYMARLGASYNIGFIVGPFIGGILASPGAGSIGFKIPLLVASSFGGLAALGVTLFVRESRQRRPAIVRVPRPWEMFGYAARHPVIGQLILLTFVVGVAFTGIESTFGLWAQHRFGWQPRDVGMVFGVTGAVSALSQFFVTGPLSRRYGEARMLAVGMAGTALCIGLQPLSDGRFLTYGLMALMAMFQSVAFPNSGALMSRSIDENNQGQIMGLNNASGAIARVVGPAAALQLFDSLNVNAPFFMGALIVAPAIFLALSAGRAALAEQREARAAA